MRLYKYLWLFTNSLSDL